MPKVIAIIPAKANSIRVEGKNIRLIGTKTLIERKIEQLREVNSIDKIIVGTNSDKIAEIALTNGASVLMRDEFYCDEVNCSANEMIVDLASRADGEIVLWAHCTNPFVNSSHYESAINEYYRALFCGYDSLISVTRVQSHLWSREAKPINFEPLREPHQLASTLNPIFYQNGAIFIQDRAQMVSLRYFYGENPFLFEVDGFAGFDINTEEDLEIARHLVEIF
jgi:CMP-N,N'-diacetyllegionaminic acid synthase